MEPSVQLYKFHISLLEVKPVIWRRVVIPVKWRLDKVAWTIILAMGWTNSHLHDTNSDDSGRLFRLKAAPYSDSFRPSLHAEKPG